MGNRRRRLTHQPEKSPRGPTMARVATDRPATLRIAAELGDPTTTLYSVPAADRRPGVSPRVAYDAAVTVGARTAVVSVTASVSVGLAIFFSLYSLLAVTRPDQPGLSSVFNGTMLACVLGVQAFVPALVQRWSLRLVIAGSLLALAVGATTVKMGHGHHGANHPVRRNETGRVEITSMNHSFAVDAQSLPEGVRETHVSLFDGSNCGIELEGRPVFSVQYHPEASPGPQDSSYLFQRFAADMRARRGSA